MFQLVSFLSGKAQVRSRGQSARAMPPHPTPIEWYPQILQNKQNVHIILQQLFTTMVRKQGMRNNQNLS